MKSFSGIVWLAVAGTPAVAKPIFCDKDSGFGWSRLSEPSVFDKAVKSPCLLLRVSRNTAALNQPSAIDPAAGRDASPTLNAAAVSLLTGLLENPARFAAEVHHRGGCRVIDCGVSASGGNRLGILLARAALGGRGEVRLQDTAKGTPLEQVWPECPWPVVEVASTDPVAACLGAQYAGWKVDEGGYFAMASGPLRAAIGGEPLFDTIGGRERPAVAVGLLESGQLPPEQVCRRLADRAGVAPDGLILLVAATASPAGTLQVVARSLETALHQLHERQFDLGRIVAGRAAAPLPPVAAADLAAIGMTNDAILYGGFAQLEVVGDDASLDLIGPQIVSSHSPAHGQPFGELFKQANGDFYALDPALFAPAVVEFINRDTGRCCRFGQIEAEVVARSFSAAG